MKKISISMALMSNLMFGWTYEDYLAQQQKNEQIYMNQVESNYNKYMNQVQANIKKYEKILGSIWGEAELSTNKKSVNYSDDYKVKEVIDYEKGKLRIEVISNEGIDKKYFDKKIENMKKETLKQSVKKDPKLDGFNSDDETRYNAEILPKDINEKDIKTQTNNNQVIYYIDVPLVKNYHKKLASLYMVDIDKYSQKYGVAKEYILGIIQTESNFDPKATSHIPAFGLMQLVPSSGAMDAYSTLTGEKRLLPKYYLLNPSKNIELGTVYIYKIQTNYLKGIKNPKSLYYATSTSYNAGIGTVYKSFDRTKSGTVKSINNMSDEELYNHLRDRRYFTQEAVDYVKKVRTNTAMWQKEIVE